MRWIAIFLACLAMLAAPDAASAKTNPLAPQITGGHDVAIKNIRIVVSSTSSNQAGPNAQWYIITFTFTNSTGYDFIPQLNKFMFQEPDTVVVGQTNGSPDLIGLENPHQNQVLKAGDSFDYTIGFLINTNTAGYVFYNPV